MKLWIAFLLIFLATGCNSNNDRMNKIIFLHHSTGEAIWKGKTNKYIYRLTGKGDVQRYFDSHNRKNKTDYYIMEMNFPKSSPYGWNNYPYDFWKLWVDGSCNNSQVSIQCPDQLCQNYEIIIFKHFQNQRLFLSKINLYCSILSDSIFYFSN